jgi:hypothetical protein
MINNQIDTIHTPCKNCVFAHFNENTQTDCHLNYIEKYKNKNISILEAYDDDKEFYIINGKKCLGYRENKWFKQFNLENAAIKDKINKYLETNVLDYLLIINLKHISLNELEIMLKQISESKIQPKKLILIRYADSDQIFQYANIEQLLQKYSIKYTWRIQTILDLSLSYKQIIHNIITTNPKYRFIISNEKFNDNLEKMIITTNKIVHEELDQFDVLSNSDYSSIVFSSIVYRFDAFHGNNLLTDTSKYKII